MLISEIQEVDVEKWCDGVDDAPSILIRVLNGSWSYRDLAEVIAIWTHEEGIDD